MASTTKLVVIAICATAVLVVAVQWMLGQDARTYARNEKIIADALAEREARMTPAERKARDDSKAAAIEMEANARAAERERLEAAAFLNSSRGACLIMLRKVLHDPGSAQYGSTLDWPITIDESGRAVVLPRIRAKNGFGAYRLATYRCAVERSGGDVRVVSLEQIT